MSWQPIQSAFISREYAELIKLIEEGISPDSIDDEGNTLLHHACGNCDLPTIYILLNLGANVNIFNKNNETMLGFLCSYNDEDENLRVIAARKIIKSGHPLTLTPAYKVKYSVLAASNDMSKLSLFLQVNENSCASGDSPLDSKADQ
jgi:hypothetical protein